MSFLVLLKRIRRRHRRARMAQLERDFATIVERTRRERNPETVRAVAERLHQSLNDIQQRLISRPADRATVGYDLTQSNRAARNENDQIAFTALTLSIIHWRSQQLSQLIAAELSSECTPESDFDFENPTSIEYQATRFIADPQGDNSVPEQND